MSGTVSHFHCAAQCHCKHCDHGFTALHLGVLIPLIVNFPFLTAKLLPVPARWEHGASGKASVAGLCYKAVPNVNRSIK